MNTILFSLLLVTSNQVDIKESRGLIMPFHISRTETDLTLPKNKALLTFHFMAYSSDAPVQKTVKFRVDGCDTITPTIDSLGNCKFTILEGKHNFEFYKTNCPKIKVDSLAINGQTQVDMNIYFQNPNIMVVVCKPVIYLYPPQETPVKIKLDVKGELGFTWPNYGDEWNVLAYPTGKIQDEGTMYNYLFWDGKMKLNKLNYDNTKGSIVLKSKLAGFLEQSLTNLGFTSMEIQDFITYWAPKMLENEFNYVHFLVNENYDQIASISVEPKPANILRVYMLWQKVKDEKSITCTPQEFKTMNREGFTYVEWGGTEIPTVKGL